MFEGFCPSFANQYIGFNLPISLLCVDVNLGIFLPLPPQHSRLWKKEGVSLPLWWLCISNISLFGQLFSYSKDPQVFVIDLIRSFKQTANIILECFFSIIVCIVLLLSLRQIWKILSGSPFMLLIPNSSAFFSFWPLEILAKLQNRCYICPSSQDGLILFITNETKPLWPIFVWC